MQYNEIIEQIKSNYNDVNIAGMARYGISTKNNYGSPIPFLRALAKRIGKDHELALRLWNSEIHDARLLAAMIGIHEELTSRQMDKWASECDSWDLVDSCCSNLFRYSRYAYPKIIQWSKSSHEFVKRSAFSLIAGLAVSDKQAPERTFINLLPIIIKASVDERNMVKKAVNWALRGIGKRNMRLNKAALTCAKRILKIDTPAARWIARDAIRELTNPKTISMIHKRK